jgi:hypothetical protein
MISSAGRVNPSELGPSSGTDVCQTVAPVAGSMPRIAVEVAAISVPSAGPE